MRWPAIMLGGAAVAAALAQPADAGDVVVRVLPVLLFLVTVTVLAELADAAQVFDVVAVRAARAVGGRTLGLFLALIVVGSVVTVLLSLDTTAVLFTPVVLAVAQRLDLDPAPFALAAVWTANVASLLLPVSNLTNLLAAEELGLTPAEYVARMAAPALVSLLVMTAFILLLHRRRLRGRYVVPAVVAPDDRLLCAGVAGACLLLVPALVAGMPPAAAACAAAAVAVVLVRWRRPAALRWSLVPWRLTLAVLALFVVMHAVGELGLDSLLREGVGSPLQTAYVSAGAANLLNNLPAYLAMERVVPEDQLLATLLGVNLGPLVLPWGSLATILWAQRCRARGVEVNWVVLGAAGAVLAPVLLLVTVPLV